MYTLNNQFRCSKVSAIPFGNSDHDLISYVRYSKEPPAPARTIRRRSYKNFVAEDFIADLTNSNWYLVYSSQDVDTAVERFTALFNEALDHHAPLITYQQRKKYTPWVTSETLDLMKKRDKAKHDASILAKAGENATTAWAEYRKIRNKINNRLR